RVALNVGQFSGRQTPMFFRPPVEHEPEYKPDESQRPGEEESPLPAKLHRDKRHKKRRGNGADVGAGIEDAGCQCPFFFGEPFRNRFYRTRKVSSLAKRQTK